MAEHPENSPANLIEPAMDIMIQANNDNDFHYWESRLSIQLCSADAEHALALLNLAAHDPAGARAESLLDTMQARMHNAAADEAKRTFIRLRDILQRDAYWRADETSAVKRYRFCLEPLRRWWLKRNTL